jgi:hypothetical protein
VPSTAIVNFAVILVAEPNDTSSAVTVAPEVELTAVTNGTDTKLVPAIVSVCCAFVITVGVTELKVGLVSPCIVTLPPKDTELPFIVIAEFCNFEFAIDPANSSFVIALFGRVKVVPAGKVIVSPFSPS